MVKDLKCQMKVGCWMLVAWSAGVVGGVGWGLDTGYSMLAVPVLLGASAGAWILDTRCWQCRCCWGVGWGLASSIPLTPDAQTSNRLTSIQYPIDAGRSDLKPADQHRVSSIKYPIDTGRITASASAGASAAPHSPRPAAPPIYLPHSARLRCRHSSPPPRSRAGHRVGCS